MSKDKKLTLRQGSRRNYLPKEGKETSNETLHTGALLRIADAVEVIAKDYHQIIKDRDYYKRRAAVRMEQIEALERKIAAERGVKTRFKNQINELRKELRNLKNKQENAENH